MPSDKYNSIMAKATGLIYSLFDVASAQEVPFGILQYVQRILHGLTSVLLCVPFIFTDSKKCRFGSSMWWLPFIMEIVRIFIVAIFIAEVLFKQFLIRSAVVEHSRQRSVLDTSLFRQKLI